VHENHPSLFSQNETFIKIYMAEAPIYGTLERTIPLDIDINKKKLKERTRKMKESTHGKFLRGKTHHKIIEAVIFISKILTHPLGFS
jgi:hypothetical protein